MRYCDSVNGKIRGVPNCNYLHFLAQVNVLEKGNTGSVQYFILVAGGKLLKNIQVAKLEIVVLADIIIEAGKKSILVKIIINDLVAEIDHQFIIQYEGQ